MTREKGKRAAYPLEFKRVGAGSKPVSAEEMELARVNMERDVLKKATAYFAKEPI